ncbi:MAG: hypothetical protein LBN95_00565 [Prevotellaceae bacterium]|jgi:hypothetical protein|nr:hypothetical protein [Prevotellaceae bacterium]
MKKIFLTIIVLSVSVSMFSQENFETKKHLKIVEIGAGLGSMYDYGFVKAKVHFIYNYQFNPYIALGCGAGAEYYLFTEGLTVPVYANARFTYPLGKVSPYAAFGFGYDVFGFIFNGGGIYFNPSFGIKIQKSKVSWLVNVSYDMQQMSGYYYYDYNGNDYENKNIGAFAINAGIIF